MSDLPPVTEGSEPWPHDMLSRVGRGTPGGDAFSELNLAQRALQDTLTGAVLPDDVSADVTARLREITEIAAKFVAPESERLDGLRPDLPARGMPFMPDFMITGADDETLRGHVRFSRFHLGGNGAAHGGSIALLFDDILGMAVNHGATAFARTAYLKTNYRRITPLDVTLDFDAGLDRVDGRKRFATGRIYGPDGQVVADAEGLFITLLPGQA